MMVKKMPKPAVWLAVFAFLAAAVVVPVRDVKISAASAEAAVPAASVLTASGAVSSTDAVRFDLIKHEMRINPSGGEASLDGKAAKVAAPIKRNGRLYVPLRALGESGAVSSVAWNSAKRQVRVVSRREELNFRIGSIRVYDGQGKALPAENFTIPAPLLVGGTAYVPVRTLAFFGLSAGTENGQLFWRWSEKKVQVLQPYWETGEDQAVFTVLYAKELYAPGAGSPIGSGVWFSLVRKIVGKDISLDGSLYNRIQLSMPLEPGINPVEISTMGMAAAGIRIRRNVSDPSAIPVNITDEGKGFLTLESPASGYLKLKSGDSFTISGKVINSPNLAINKLTVMIQRYVPDAGDIRKDFTTVSTKEIQVKNGMFSGSVTFSQSGSYRIYVNGLSYSTFPGHGPDSVTWANLSAEVVE
ncbi:copper amine oxidase N-terminal domain-containing protein [Paenibacillus zanthoxyli]|uniref:copper amine oxidase N-terminal domain-containing protein n=1 Tax=Paenibacillus zanthoxyli TaxID=369399 RepID=UPI000472905B|nr:copper amine oxidase N-terminal domain-containing protein [Paenibacillus zanthoxyli]